MKQVADLASIPDMGMIVPDMGKDTASTHSTQATGLADALFTLVQQRVLGLLFGQPKRRFQSAELIRLAGSGTGAVHRVLTRLADAGLITTVRQGNQKYYQANPDSPVFAELQGLVVKTVGLVEPLRQTLAPTSGAIHAAFVYGSVARGTDHADSDIDLMIVSDTLGYPDVFEKLKPAEVALGRPVNPNVMTRAEWRKKRMQPDSFAARIAAQPKLFVIGSEDALG